MRRKGTCSVLVLACDMRGTRGREKEEASERRGSHARAHERQRMGTHGSVWRRVNTSSRLSLLLLGSRSASPAPLSQDLTADWHAFSVAGRVRVACFPLNLEPSQCWRARTAFAHPQDGRRTNRCKWRVTQREKRAEVVAFDEDTLGHQPELRRHNGCGRPSVWRKGW